LTMTMTLSVVVLADQCDQAATISQLFFYFFMRDHHNLHHCSRYRSIRRSLLYHWQGPCRHHRRHRWLQKRKVSQHNIATNSNNLDIEADTGDDTAAAPTETRGPGWIPSADQLIDTSGQSAPDIHLGRRARDRPTAAGWETSKGHRRSGRTSESRSG